MLQARSFAPSTPQDRGWRAFRLERWPFFDEAKHPLLPLLLAAIIPVLLFAGWMAYRTAAEQRAATLKAASVTVDRVAERVAAEINAQIQVAQTLALSPALDRPDLPAFRQQAERLKAARSLWHTVELDDADGLQIMNLLRAPGQPLGATADRASFEEAISRRRPVVGGVGPIGPVSGLQLVALRVPVLKDEAVRYVLTIAFASEAIQQIMQRAGIPPGWVGTVVDRQGDLIARTSNAPRVVGDPKREAVRKAIGTAEGGLYEAQTLEGTDVETLFRKLPDVGGWSIHLSIPSSDLEPPVRRALVAVASGVAGSLLLAVVLAGVMARRFEQQRGEERRRAATALQMSEDRGRLAVEAAGLGTWLWDVRQDRLTGSQRFRSMMHLPDTDSPNWAPEAFLNRVHRADRPALVQAAQHCLDSAGTFEAEFRVPGSDSSVCWLRAVGRAMPGPEANVLMGVVADTTAQKQAEAERLKLLSRLSAAQDDVQARIARELHDQVGQTVTGLSLGLKGLENSLSGTENRAARERVAWLQQLTREIGRDLHRVAVDLRPTALDDLGFFRAIAAYAKDWSERYGIGVDVEIASVGKDGLSREKESAIYRVVQEALNNVLKHAAATHVSVVIEARSGELRVVIEDNGRGFDPATVHAAGAAMTPSQRRLGFSGMRERLALVGGSLQIEAEPGAGTSLFINIPLAQPAVLDADP